MSMINRFNWVEGEATLRRCASNIRSALTLLARPARLHGRPLLLRTPRDIAIASVGAIVIFFILMALIDRSEEHTSELQSHVNLVCRLLLEKKNKNSTLLCIVD